MLAKEKKILKIDLKCSNEINPIRFLERILYNRNIQLFFNLLFHLLRKNTVLKMFDVFGLLMPGTPGMVMAILAREYLNQWFHNIIMVLKSQQIAKFILQKYINKQSDKKKHQFKYTPSQPKYTQTADHINQISSTNPLNYFNIPTHKNSSTLQYLYRKKIMTSILAKLDFEPRLFALNRKFKTLCVIRESQKYKFTGDPNLDTFKWLQSTSQKYLSEYNNQIQSLIYELCMNQHFFIQNIFQLKGVHLHYSLRKKSSKQFKLFNNTNQYQVKATDSKCSPNLHLNRCKSQHNYISNLQLKQLLLKLPQASNPKVLQKLRQDYFKDLKKIQKKQFADFNTKHKQFKESRQLSKLIAYYLAKWVNDPKLCYETYFSVFKDNKKQI